MRTPGAFDIHVASCPGQTQHMLAVCSGVSGAGRKGKQTLDPGPEGGG